MCRGLRQFLEEELTDLSSIRRRSLGLTRQLALALALAGGTAILAVPGFADAANAQKRDKKKDKKGEAKPQYSSEFVAAYQPANEAVLAEGADINAVKPQLASLAAMAVSPDELAATGGLILNAGIKSQDPALQIQGVEMVLSSGKLQPEEVGRYNFVAYQISNNLADYGKAETYLQRAIDGGFTTEGVTTNDLKLNMSELFFSQQQYQRGLDYLLETIRARKAAGETIEEAWYRRGISFGYNNEIVPQTYDFAMSWVNDYPSSDNWRDAINLTRNLNEFEPDVLIDVLRLSKLVGGLRDKQDYVQYVEAADRGIVGNGALLMPQELKGLIEEAYAIGVIGKDDTYIADTLASAKRRIAADVAELPSFEKDADAANARVRTVTAAANTFLSYGEWAKAARFYEKSLGMDGVDRDQALVRLGIAQTNMGDYAAAEATFAKVTGQRAPIARLWATYAAQKAQGSATAAS
jgi:tetratricopeptide (TPR) repeat protein